MTIPPFHGFGGRRLVASLVIAAILVVTLISAVAYRSESTGSQTSSRETSFFSSGSAASSGLSSETSLGTTELHFLYPCNCSYDLKWAWPMYKTLGALKSASSIIVVAQVTSTRTVGVNMSTFPASPFTAPKSLIPVTGYNITVTTVLSGGPGLTGETLFVTQIGGTASGTTMNLAGYPGLSIGQSYVFFLSCCSGTGELLDLYEALDPYFTYITTGGPQGLFSVQGGNVYSLDNIYPQADAWLPVKANGIPLAQFVAEVQAATVATTVSQSATNSSSTTGYSTSTVR